MQFIVYEECYFNISIITFYIKDTILHMRIIYDVTFFLLIYLKTPLEKLEYFYRFECDFL